MNNQFSDRQIEIMEAAMLRIDQHGIQELTIKNLAADLNLSEAALYRHFKSKNEILLSLLDYFISDLNARIEIIVTDKAAHPSDLIRGIFTSQLNNIVKRPSIVSVIFSEGIFHFNKELRDKVTSMMGVIQEHIREQIHRGQEEDIYGKLLGAGHITTVILGSMRMVVLKWKFSGKKSNLVKDGTTVLNGVLKMLEK